MLYRDTENKVWVVFIHGEPIKGFADHDMAAQAEKLWLKGDRDRTTKGQVHQYYPKDTAASVVKRFVDDMLEIDQPNVMRKVDLYEEYIDWGGRLERSAFFRALRKVADVFPLQLMRNGVRECYIKGVRLK